MISNAGIASRRKAEDLIRQGCVAVNGQTVWKLGTRADPARDYVKVNGKLIRPQPMEYYAVNKPKGVLCSLFDPARRRVVTALIQSRGRVYCAGRLDFQSEGLVILTNDGDLVRQVTQAGGVGKIYQVKVRGQPFPEAIRKLCQGVVMGRERLASCLITLVKEGLNCWYEVVLHQGRNRQIRRMFGRIGHPVMRIRRTAIGPVCLGELQPGSYRKLSSREVRLLKREDRTPQLCSAKNQTS